MKTSRIGKVFVGYDPREDIAYQVCKRSLVNTNNAAFSVHPLRQNSLRELGLYSRPADKLASTEFSLTRFLTPYLAAQSNWSIFADCDFLFTKGFERLAQQLDPAKAVYVVQHEYVPSLKMKMDSVQQSIYPRKNWSSFMVFNGAHPSVQALTPEVVNTQTPAFLHRLQWVNDADIGALDIEWNFLVGEYPMPSKTPAAIHYTNGGPWFGDDSMDFAQLWIGQKDAMLREQA